MTHQTGQWVRSYSQGIWQIVRQIPEHFAPRYTLRDPKELRDARLFVLKRLVNDRWKPAFETEAAEEGFVKSLTKTDSAKLEKFLRANDAVLEQFQLFDNPVQAVLNLGFAVPRRADLGKFKRHFQERFAEPLQAGLSSDAIIKIIAETEFAAGYNDIPRAATLQFVCDGYEVKRRELIYRQLNVQSF